LALWRHLRLPVALRPIGKPLQAFPCALRCRDDGLRWPSVVCVGLVPQPQPRRVAPPVPTAIGAVCHRGSHV